MGRNYFQYGWCNPDKKIKFKKEKYKCLGL